MSNEINEHIKVQPFACMQYFYKSEGLPRIRSFIQFEGRIDENLLKKAVDMSIDAVPLINCVFDEESFSWKQCDFTAADIIHIIDDAESEGNGDTKWLTKDLDFTREPQLKIILLRQVACDKLFVIINHMVADGCGFKDYLYLLGNLYTQCENETFSGFNKKALKKQSFSQVSHNFSMKKRWKILSSKLNVSMPPESFKFPLKGDPDNAVVLIKNIDNDSFNKIRKYAKDRGASINDIIITAYVRDIYRTLKVPEITIPCPVDLRKFGKKKQIFGICNLTGLYNCTVNISENEAFDETLHKVTAQMNVQKLGTDCMKLPMFLDMIFRTLPLRILINRFSKMRMTPFITYTNLGIIDEKRLCFGSYNVEKAYITTAIKRNQYFQLSVSTFKDCCTLSASLFATEEDVTFANGVLNNVKNELEGLAQQ